ncbi:MAG: response regulator [Planctomycetaceae bacterium]|nr:response regulator [Planctomycetaceae bacterium]
MPISSTQEPSTAPEKQLRVRYAVGLALVAGLTIASHLYVESMIRQQADDAPVINKAGRQRMLSQKLTKATFALNTAKTPSEHQDALQELCDALILWQRSHGELMANFGSATATNAAVTAAFADMQPYYSLMCEAGHAIIAAPRDSDILAKNSDIIRRNEAEYLPRMNTIVGLLDQAAGQRVESLKRLQRVLLTVTLIVLGLEAIFVFEPAARTIQKHFRFVVAARERAEETNRLKSQFLANMSHELRTPLNGVMGMLDLLLQTELTENQTNYAKVSRSSAGSLLEIINDILDYSKIEARQLELESTPFDLRNLVEEVASLGAAQVNNRPVEVVLHYSPELPRGAIGDPLRLRQILTNLLNNALKFTESGHVILRVSLTASGESESTIQFCIADTGIGIPADRVDTIFDKFTQADGSTTRKFGGTGLGLGISSELVRLMGSQIDVESEPGVGSRFAFTITLDHAEVTISDIKNPEQLQTARVLVVDDLAINREILNGQLSPYVNSVITASCAAEALKLLTDRPEAFDIVLTDYCMPDVDGEELGRQIRQRPELADMVLVMLTSSCRDLSRKRLTEIGFAECVVKPASYEFLLQTLSDAISQSRRHVPATAEDAPSDGNADSYRVLVAEDNLVNQMVVRECLKNMNCSVTVCDNGKSALEILQRQRFDIVLMDCHMPVMDGYEATRRIRELPHPAGDIPVIALTANALIGDRERSLEAGMNDHLSKPFRPHELEQVMRQWARVAEADGTPPRPSTQAVSS